jgi:hypothetical protein
VERYEREATMKHEVESPPQSQPSCPWSRRAGYTLPSAAAKMETTSDMMNRSDDNGTKISLKSETSTCGLVGDSTLEEREREQQQHCQMGKEGVSRTGIVLTRIMADATLTVDTTETTCDNIKTRKHTVWRQNKA